MMNYGINNAYPQKAIIMDVVGQTANVFIPLAKYDTGLIESTVQLDPSMVGHEVVITFINGDRNQGVITGIIDSINKIKRGTIAAVSGNTAKVSFPDGSETGFLSSCTVLSAASVGHAAVVVFETEDISSGIIAGVVQ